jgi:hypothetical protein
MDVAAEAAPERMITEPLTWDEICKRYPDERVCVVEIVWDEPKKWPFRFARVIGHGKTRRAPVEQARIWLDSYFSLGYYYTGKIEAPIPRLFL